MKTFSIGLVIILLATMLTGISTAYTEAVNAEVEETNCHTKYYGLDNFVKSTETISYTTKDVDKYNLAVKYPSYFSGKVTCVPVAGMCIIGYYDMFYPNLIPDFTPAKVVGSNYLYVDWDENGINAALQLASDMGLSNPSTDGATVSDFKRGMSTYCSRKSLSISMMSCMKSGKFDWDIAISYLNVNKPLILFLSAYNITSINQFTNSDSLTIYTATDNHAMAVFGYQEITYKLTNGQTRTDRYLCVATDIDTMPSAFLKIDSNVVINDSYAISIS